MQKGYTQIISTICWLRTWAKDYKVFSGIHIFQEYLALFVTGIADQVVVLIETSAYSPGFQLNMKVPYGRSSKNF